MNGSWTGPDMTPSTSMSKSKTRQPPLPQTSLPTTTHKSNKNNGLPSSSTSLSSEGPSDKYNALVVDSGAIIKHSGFSTLHNSASRYYTTSGVMDEIRDSKARHHLETLPFELELREPSKDGISHVIEFSKKTGDYASLSIVDLQVLGLLYDLEKEGCSDMTHIRTEPKRMLGVGRVVSLGGDDKNKTITINDKNCPAQANGAQSASSVANREGVSFFEGEVTEEIESSEDDSYGDYEEDEEIEFDDESGNEEPMKVNDDEEFPPRSKANDTASSIGVKKSWAMLVSPKDTAASPIPSLNIKKEESKVADTVLSSNFGSMNLSSIGKYEKRVDFDIKDESKSLGGQFSDAEEDESFGEYENEILSQDSDGNISDDDGYAASDAEISDEECDVYILDPEEVEERKRKLALEEKDNSETLAFSSDTVQSLPKSKEEQEVEHELASEFPSLAAASTVPYEGSDTENKDESVVKEKEARLTKAREEEERRKAESLKPLTKNGRVYNSFRKYKDLVKPQGLTERKKSKQRDGSKTLDGSSNDAIPNLVESTMAETDAAASLQGQNRSDKSQSRIIGGIGMSGQGTEVDDDGEGWVTSIKEIKTMKASGSLDPGNTGNHHRKGVEETSFQSGLPDKMHRAACATTDFAMQNVILQMNLELLTVDGVKVRRLKSWVTRCGACLKVYTGGDNDGKRLFCAKCGSDGLQRVAASVDGKTGRLRLHLSKKYKKNLRGTQFALPKAGKGNRFQGDLLLREDQLLYGAWNQKMKRSKSKKEAQSIFGSDIASTVGCHTDLTKRDDIKVGFGRRNPNSSKFGRERRGKKKKSVDNKACGLRRY